MRWILKRDNRLTVYKGILEILERNTKNPDFYKYRGICGALVIYRDENHLSSLQVPYPDGNSYAQRFIYYPELLAFMPKKPWNNCYFYFPDEDGLKKRIKLMKNIIKAMETKL